MKRVEVDRTADQPGPRPRAHHDTLEPPAIGLWTYEPDANALTCDDAMRALIGEPPGETPLHLDDYLRHVHPDDQRRLDALFRNGRAHSEPALEHRLIRPDGTLCWAIARVYEETTHGRPSRIGCVVDTSEHHALSDKLLELQKLAALGQLSAGVAHTFNNLLAAMLPSLEVAQRHATPAASSALTHAREAALRAARLVKQLLVLSGRHASLERGVIDLGALARRVVESCRVMFDPRVTIELEGAEGLKVLGDGATLEQALLNLLLNAYDAVNELDAANQERAPWIRVAVESCDDASGAVRVRVTDNGIGFTDAARRHMFEPFFTAEATHGTGLALAAAQAIAREHAGTLECDSTPGHGATFTLTLPGHESTGERRRRVAAQPTILIAEDEAAVRQLLAGMMREAGYRVIEAVDGLAALELYKEHDGLIDLCVIDQAMPRMNGQALLGILLGLDPKLKAISITGFGVGLKGARAVLEKPLSAELFLGTIKSVLAIE